MGFFKSKEEREAKRRRKELEAMQLEQKISSSPMTQQLQAFILDKFGDLNSEEVDKLRRLETGGGYRMEVQSKGILFILSNWKGETLDKWSISFDALGYQDLPDAGVYVLRKILLQTLSSIPHLKVLDTGFFKYERNRTKQSW